MLSFNAVDVKRYLRWSLVFSVSQYTRGNAHSNL